MLLVRWGNNEEKKKMCMHSVKISPEKTGTNSSRPMPFHKVVEELVPARLRDRC